MLVYIARAKYWNQPKYPGKSSGLNEAAPRHHMCMCLLLLAGHALVCSCKDRTQKQPSSINNKRSMTYRRLKINNMTLGAQLLTGHIEIYFQLPTRALRQQRCNRCQSQPSHPSSKADRLSSSQWNKFCEDLDEALKPATKMRKVMLVE